VFFSFYDIKNAVKTDLRNFRKQTNNHFFLLKNLKTSQENRLNKSILFTFADQKTTYLEKYFGETKIFVMKDLKIKKINKHIVDWLRTYAQKSNAKGFVVGISGGVDSAVVAYLCAQTGLETLFVEMPIGQKQPTIDKTKKLLEKLHSKFPNVRSTKVDLTTVFNEFKNNVSQNISQDKLNLTLANTQARFRMLTLYYQAGIHSFLVVGTGNKIEDFGIGFYTKYGDGGVDISPIADLMKSEVYKLAEYLDVPESIRFAAPTDGLFGDNRSDEDQIGANYDELEKVMKAHQNGKKANDFSEREKEVFEIYTRLNTINQHKMNPIPICKIPIELKS